MNQQNKNKKNFFNNKPNNNCKIKVKQNRK